MPPDDEVLPAEEQPLPAAALPTDQLPGYIPESDPEEDPEEDDEDPEEDPADYPADRADDDDEEEEEEPSRDDADDKDEDEEEEEEHPAPADSVPHVHRMTARISIWAEPSISLPSREEVERLLALTTPPSSPLTPLSSPLPQIPSPPLLVPPPVPVIPPPLPTSPTYSLGYRAVIVRLRGPRYEVEESSFAAAARPTRGRRADYGFFGTMDTEIRRQRAKEVGYRIRDVWVDPREAVEEVAPMTLEGVNTRVTELAAEALVSREAWGRSIEVSYMARSEIMALRSIVKSQQAVISQFIMDIYPTGAACVDFDIDAVTTGASDHSIGTCGSTAGTAGTLWRSSIASICHVTEMIDQGVTAALVACDVTRNGDDSHTSGTGVRRSECVAQECTYQDFMKCQPLYFKGTEGVVEKKKGWIPSMKLMRMKWVLNLIKRKMNKRLKMMKNKRRTKSKVEDNAEGDEDKGMDYTTNQYDDDVDIRLNDPVNTDEGFIQKEGTNTEMINVQQGNENLEITLNQVIEDAHVTISTIAKNTDVPVTSSSHSFDLASKFLNFADIPPTDAEIVSLMDVHVHHEVPSYPTPTLLTVLVLVITESLPVYTAVIPQSLPSFTHLLPQSTPTPPPTIESTNPLSTLPNFTFIF
ncbi:hypothetical protein Tco_1245274 [Tanacetum coccineum]